MERDVKIGVLIGIVLLAFIAFFYSRNAPQDSTEGRDAVPAASSRQVTVGTASPADGPADEDAPDDVIPVPRGNAGGGEGPPGGPP